MTHIIDNIFCKQRTPYEINLGLVGSEMGIRDSRKTESSLASQNRGASGFAKQSRVWFRKTVSSLASQNRGESGFAKQSRVWLRKTEASLVSQNRVESGFAEQRRVWLRKTEASMVPQNRVESGVAKHRGISFTPVYTTDAAEDEYSSDLRRCM